MAYLRKHRMSLFEKKHRNPHREEDLNSDESHYRKIAKCLSDCNVRRAGCTLRSAKEESSQIGLLGDQPEDNTGLNHP